jgi:hypothetical protein
MTPPGGRAGPRTPGRTKGGRGSPEDQPILPYDRTGSARFGGLRIALSILSSFLV